MFFEQKKLICLSKRTIIGIREIRADEPKNSSDREDILKNAKQSSEGCFTVPKVV